MAHKKATPVISNFSRIKKSIFVYILVLFILTRLLYAGLGSMGMRIFSQGLPPSVTMPTVEISKKLPVQMWYTWDAQHYAYAARGYNLSLKPLPVSAQKDGKKLYYLVHWFPVYPVMAKLLSLISGISIPYSLLIVSNAAFLMALYLLYKLANFDEDDTFGRLVIAVFFLLPASFLFSAALSESTFLLLSLATIYSARKERWLLAGLCGFFVALTRSAGFLIAIPLFIEAIQQYGWHGEIKELTRKYAKPLAGALLAGLGFGTYMAYCWARTGDPMTYVSGAYVGWGVVFANPLAYVLHNFAKIRTLVLVAQIILVLSLWQKVRWSYIAYTLVLAFAALSVGSVGEAGMLRYMAPAFPVAIAAAYLIKREKLANYVWVTLGILNGSFFILWICWWQGFII